MEPFESHAVTTWYKNFSLKKGQGLILNLRNERVELREKIFALTEYVKTTQDDPENYPVSVYDSIIVSSLAGVDDNELPNIIPAVWYGLGLQVGSYDLWEVDRIINESQATINGATNDISILLRNIRECAKDENALDFCHAYIKKFIKNNSISFENQLSWSGITVMTLGLCVVYERLYQLSDEEQNLVLKNTFYLAICADLPVRASIQAVLFNTRTVFSLVPAYIRLLDSLENSSELILINSPEQKNTLSVVWKKYLDSTEEQWADIPQLIDFCTKSGQDSFEKDRIFIALSILQDLKAGTLQPHNRGDIMSESDIYRSDVIKLLFWFGLGEGVGVELLTEYFTQPEPRVSVRNFIIRLKEVCNLTNQITVENILTFTNVVHDLKMIPLDQELIVYNESTQKFEWTQI